MNKFVIYPLLAMPLLCQPSFAATPVEQTFRYEDNEIVIRLAPRTGQQIAAFYEGRGFPAEAIRHLAGHCFITTSLRNKSERVTWLRLADWRFVAEPAPIRISLSEWQQYWKMEKLPANLQSTFYWTQLPDELNMQPSESVGGNLVFQYSDHPFNVDVTLRSGEQMDGPVKQVQIKNVQCRKE